MAEKHSGQCYENLVVLVELVDGMQTVEVRPAPVRAWLYRVDNERLRTGQGRLYRIEFGSIRYKILPFFVEREEKIFPLPSTDLRKSRGKMIEGGAQVVQSIPDDEGKAVWDWLRWIEDNHISPLVRVHKDFIEPTFRELDKFGLQIVDVMIGPLDF